MAGERLKVLSAAIGDLPGAPGEVLDGQLTIACGEQAIRPLALHRRDERLGGPRGRRGGTGADHAGAQQGDGPELARVSTADLRG